MLELRRAAGGLPAGRDVVDAGLGWLLRVIPVLGLGLGVWGFGGLGFRGPSPMVQHARPTVADGKAIAVAFLALGLLQHERHDGAAKCQGNNARLSRCHRDIRARR